MVERVKVLKQLADEKRRLARQMRAAITYPSEAPVMNGYAEMLEAEAAAIEHRIKALGGVKSRARSRRRLWD